MRNGPLFNALRDTLNGVVMPFIHFVCMDFVVSIQTAAILFMKIKKIFTNAPCTLITSNLCLSATTFRLDAEMITYFFHIKLSFFLSDDIHSPKPQKLKEANRFPTNEIDRIQKVRQQASAN